MMATPRTVRPEITVERVESECLLHSWACGPIELRAALDWASSAGFDGATCFIQGSRAEFAQINGSAAIGPSGSGVDLARVWEFDCWSGESRLRWHRTEGMAIVSTIPRWGSGPMRDLEPVPLEARLRSHMVLWGFATGSGPSHGWSTLVEDRIDPIHVPMIALQSGSRVFLEVTELVCSDESGNSYVVDELYGEFVEVDMEGER